MAGTAARQDYPGRAGPGSHRVAIEIGSDGRATVRVVAWAGTAYETRSECGVSAVEARRMLELLAGMLLGDEAGPGAGGVCLTVAA